MERDGIIYIAFGKRYRDEALFSANSLKSQCDLPVTLFTDSAVSDAAIDHCEIIRPEHKRAKVDFIVKSPYQRTLYLDSDTKVVGDLTDLFPVLDRFNIAGVQDHSRKSYRWSSQIQEYEAIPYAFPEYNGGVLLYDRSPATLEFFELWREFFYRYRDQTNGQDQASLRIALWKSRANVHTLPFEYNVRNVQIRQKMEKRSRSANDNTLLKPRVLHWHGVEKDNFIRRLNPRYRPMKI
ncbi:glycosyltransferase [Fulvimarina sp. MAC3]|uniref:glycosyltransferase n=1 Tax=Fulvimarina sp. MAC3 TaxID=3148887 RepID=UPI0031FBAA90